MQQRSITVILRGAIGTLLAVGACGAPPEDLDREAELPPIGSATLALTQCVTVQRGIYGDVADTFINSAFPGDASSGSYPALYTGTNASGQKQSLIRFDLGFLPPAAVIESATLTLQQTYKATSSAVRVHRVTAPWSESDTSWSSFAGSFDPAALGVLATSSEFGPRSVDLTGLMQQWADGADPNHGVLLEEDPTDATQWRSSEASYVAERPALTVCWLDPTCAPGCTGPGEVCESGQCVVDCAAPGAVPCGPGTVCNVGDNAPGACVPPTDPCVVTGEQVPCGAASCGPGAACDTALDQCVPALPCTAVTCEEGVCHGTDCACERPLPACSPAPLGTLNTTPFRFGLADLDFDLDCNAWGVSMISGTDYLRRMTPSGVVTSFSGISNLNMGEVAVGQGAADQFGDDGIEVALTYICCATCGCKASPGQGVARWNPPAGNLPMVASALVTSGSGPFGSVYFDTGPVGLTWGLDGLLYVGNMSANGDLFRLDPQTYTPTNLGSFGSRVYATARFDGSRLLVALANRQIRLFDVNSATSTLFATTTQDVTSMIRDLFSGHIYIALRGGSIRELSSAGLDLGLFASTQASGRISIAGDNYLYFVDARAGSNSTVQRWPLPLTY